MYTHCLSIFILAWVVLFSLINTPNSDGLLENQILLRSIFFSCVIELGLFSILYINKKGNIHISVRNNFVQLSSNFYEKISTQIVNWVTVYSNWVTTIIIKYSRYSVFNFKWERWAATSTWNLLTKFNFG